MPLHPDAQFALERDVHAGSSFLFLDPPHSDVHRFSSTVSAWALTAYHQLMSLVADDNAATAPKLPDGYRQHLVEYPNFPAYPNSSDRNAEVWFTGILAFGSCIFAISVLWFWKDYDSRGDENEMLEVSKRAKVPIWFMSLLLYFGAIVVLVTNWKHAERQYIPPGEYPCTTLKVFLLGALIIFPIDMASWVAVLRQRSPHWSKIQAGLFSALDGFWLIFGIIICSLNKTPACCVPILWYTAILYCIAQGVTAFIVCSAVGIYWMSGKPKRVDEVLDDMMGRNSLLSRAHLYDDEFSDRVVYP